MTERVIKILIMLYVAVITLVQAFVVIMKLSSKSLEFEDFILLGVQVTIMAFGVGSFMFNIRSYGAKSRPGSLSTKALDAEITTSENNVNHRARNLLAVWWAANVVFAVSGFSVAIFATAVNVKDGSAMKNDWFLVAMILLSLSTIMLIDSIRWKRLPIQK